MTDLDPLVVEYEHDKSRPREADALLFLRKIASLVKPIMRQRGWRVGTLCEFYPDEHNLLGLNINRGQRICLRLRYPGDQRQFLPIEQVTDTMLHELCHNVHGPHDQHFHALWNQLRDEHEALVRKGYTGEGFLSEGKRLGGQRIPMGEARRRARAAAEKRRNLTAGSGQKLGGAPVLRGTDMRKVIADAAQRRNTVEKGCASGTKEGQKLGEEASKGRGFKTKAEEEDANEQAIMIAYIDLIQEEEKEKYGNDYVPPSASNPLGGSRATMSPPPIPHDSKPSLPVPTSTVKSEAFFPSKFQNDDAPSSLETEDLIDLSDVPKEEEAADTWECPICTLQNPWNFLCCDACTTERPEWLPAPPKPQSQFDPSVKQSPSRSAPLPQAHRPLKPRNNALQSLAELERSAPQKPLGWLCHRCGTFMELEWWTCASCGTMKQAS